MLQFLMILLSLSQQTPGQDLKLDHNHLFPNKLLPPDFTNL